jgi:hypothetical protein
MGRIFDGTADYLESASAAALNVGAADFTVIIWTKSSTEAGQDDRLFCKGTSVLGSESGPGVRYEAVYSDIGGGKITFTIDDNSIKEEADYLVPTELYDSSWHLWFFERDFGTAIKIFLDGNNEKASEADATGNLDNGFTLVIGAGRTSGDAIGNFWPVSLAEFVLVKRLLSGNEKDAIFKHGFRHLSTGGNPSLWLPIWGIHSPEIDLSPNGGSATVVSAPPRTNGPPIVPFSQRWWGSVPSAEVAAPAAGQDLTWQGGGMYLPPTEQIEVVAY